MQADAEFQAAATALAEKGQPALTAAERAARRRSLDGLGLAPFATAVGPPITRAAHATTLQLNVGLTCNQACAHCHVESSPLRQETMDTKTAARCLELAAAARPHLTTLDLTGGAPEMHAAFRTLVEGGAALGLSVIDRCNLTILCEPGHEDLPSFLASHAVRVVASLPCYTPATVDAQRGRGVFERSIAGLRALNAVGYGTSPDLILDLVYNPSGAFLAPPATDLEPAYRRELNEGFGVTFSNLVALNNLPVKRFADFLVKNSQLDAYMATLVSAFNPATLPRLMCRDTVSVGWDGALYDCDFNQQLAIGLGGFTRPLTVFDIDSMDDLGGKRVAVGDHCYGCTAGCGSGCQGGLV